MITPEEIYIRAPGNKCIQRVEANISGKNKRDYPVLVFFDNDELEWNSNQKPVCYYNRSWAKLGFDHKLQLPLAGEELPELHQYNLVLSTHHHSDAEESDGGQGKGKGVDRNDSEDDNGPSPIDILIRRSRLNTLVASCPASPLQCSFTPVNTRVFQMPFTTQTPASPRMVTVTICPLLSFFRTIPFVSPPILLCFISSFTKTLGLRPSPFLPPLNLIYFRIYPFFALLLCDSTFPLPSSLYPGLYSYLCRLIDHLVGSCLHGI